MNDNPDLRERLREWADVQVPSLFEALRAENERLRKKVDALRGEIAELNERRT